ncbi:FAD/NAD(P)-binding protein [Rhizocola hellebori]|uniref:FAD/NAD(P)-binding protein n=1 Tax=Rhizocola hellebori TaxID=1392758 RepID=UPI00194231B7|nr:FAD/NAD(P)-binding protein [Rhizocola hellebori]
MTTPDELAVCIIGMGPRGLALLERLVTNTDMPLRIHVVDPFAPGGRVWRTDQSAQLLTDTMAAQITIFPQAAAGKDALPRLNLYEWARHCVLFRQAGELDPQIEEEIRGIEPTTYCSRRLVGHYLAWAFRRIVADAPQTVRVTHHLLTAVALWDEPDGRQSVLLETGDRLSGLDAVALAVGRYRVTPGKTEQELASFAIENELTYILPADPADVDLTMVRPGEPTLLRGLGLGFFDYLALLTAGRGGRFVQKDYGLHYEPSGLEPQLFAGSPRGVPHRARDVHHANNSHAGLPAEALELHDGLWPFIAKQVECAYYTAQLRLTRGDHKVHRFRGEFLSLPWGDRRAEAVLRMFGLTQHRRWNWHTITRPCEGLTFDDRDEFRDWLLNYLQTDVGSIAEIEEDGPVKAAADALRELRREVRRVVDHSGLTGRWHEHVLDQWHSPMNAFLSIGPPAFRVEQMVALINAGVLELVGPSLTVGTRADVPAFVVESPQVKGSRRLVTALIEARPYAADPNRVADPLLRWLVNNGSSVDLPPSTPDGVSEASGTLHMRDVTGDAHPRRFVLGVPSKAAQWNPRPGVASVLLGESDAISQAMLSLTPAPHFGG